MIFNQYIKLKPIGASLSIAGISLGMYMDFFFKGVAHWTVMFMVLSVVLLADWKNVCRFHYPSFNVILKWIVIFQLFMVFYWTLSGSMSFQLLSYNLYIISICYAYGSIDNFDDFKNLPYYLFWVSLPSLLIAVFLCYSGFYEIEVHREMETSAGGKDELKIDSLTMTYGAIYPVFALLCYKQKGILIKALLIFTIILSSYVLLESGKRTPSFLLILGVVLAQYSKGVTLKKILCRPGFVLYFIVFIILLVVLYASNDFVQEKTDNIFNTFVDGVKGLMGIKSADIGASVEQRLYVRRIVDQYVSENFSFFNYIFGGGYYVVDQIDNPIYQSYLDMGIIGFCMFAFFDIVFPISIFFKRPQNSTIVLSILLSLQPIVTIYSSGTPYHHVKYVQICLLAYVYYAYKKERLKVKKRLINESHNDL